MKTAARRLLIMNRIRLSMLAGIFSLSVAILAVPIYSVHSSSLGRIDTAKPANASQSESRVRGVRADSLISNSALTSVRSLLATPTASPETIETYAANCSTPKSTFLLGETVCAKTNDVDLGFPGGRWVDWILTGTTYTTVSGSRTTTLIGSNPQTFIYTPTATGVYKVEITEDDGNGGDNPQTPAVFTVQLPTLSTYASNCMTAKSSFNLGETVCVKVSGLANGEWQYRRVQFATPDNFVLNRSDVLDNSQQSTYVLPSTDNQAFSGVTVNHLGTWNVSLIDPDANLTQTVQITVHKSNILADRVADLQASKLYIDKGDPPSAGTDVTFQIFIYNAGPDPATNVTLADVTLPNTTFVSFARNALIASNAMPESEFGALAQNTFFNKDLLRFLHDSRDQVFSNSAFSEPSFLFTPEDSPLTFNCTSPSAGSAGTTNCTATGEMAPGETAIFTAVYKVSTSVANGTALMDDNSVTVGSATTDQSASTNTSAADITTSNPNPPACTLTCPDNITVGTNTTNAGNPGAIVNFGPEPAGNCGTGLTSTPASGTFFPVGSTTVTSQTGSGASCSFVVTVVNTPQPTITCAADQTAAASSGQSTANVTVNPPSYAGSFATGQTPAPLTSSRSDQLDIADPYPIGTTLITWMVTDQYGTSKSCTQRVIVTSASAPTISCPSDKTFTANSGCERTLTSAEIGTPTTGGAASSAGEDCPVGNPCAVRSDRLALTAPFPAGQTTITWTATNDLGSVSCTQVITISTVGGSDTTPPTLSVPPDISLSTSDCAVLLDDELGVATADDDCTGAVNITRTGLPQIACPIPGNPSRTCDSFYFPTGTTNIVYTATDAAGNTSTAVQHIVIAESPAIPPTITAPANLTIDTLATDTSCGTFIGDATLGTATATDNCPGVTVARTGVPAGNVFPVGDTFITYTATDRTNHTAFATQKVTVRDKTKPVLSCPSNITVYLPLNSTATSMPVNYPAATATDNCPGTVGIGYSAASGSTFPMGTTTVNVTATDANNNSSSCAFTVTVLYNFTGFFSPVSNMPTLNTVNAGRAIPVKFSLSGNKGLSIFAANNPYSVSFNCSTSDPGVDIIETVNAGGSSLNYSPDTYNYVWKTESSWAGTCRQLVLTLNDGSVHKANFKFK